MTRIAALALVLAAPSASAATLTPWEPGASPCAGACSQEWAREQTGARDGEMQPLTIPAGTPILWMAYAVDGQPYGIDYHGRPTLRELAATGYPLGNGRWLVQIEECGNMAIVWMPGGIFTELLRETGLGEIDAPPPATSTPPGTTPGSTPPPGLPGGSVTVRWHEPIEVEIDPPEKPDPEPETKPPAPVSLPAAFGLLAMAIGVLAWIGRRRNRT